MVRDLLTSLVTVLACTLVLGLAYPLVVVGIAQVAFERRADGDPALIARDTRDDPRDFQPRPSQTDYDATATAFSNRGPNQASATAFYREQIAAYREFNGTTAIPPVDAVTTSGSGVDPHISQANAALQARRVARVRGLEPARVQALVREHTGGGLLGEPVVNTTTLNEALGR